MAGSQDPSDNPVGINVVPLVDIIFCLCVFFMCSFKFKAIEGKFDSWLPGNSGHDAPLPPDIKIISEVRVALVWDDATGTVIRKLGVRVLSEDDDLATAITAAHAAWVERGRPEAPVTIDADVRVPWSEVVRVVNVAKRCDIDKIEFAMGAAPLPHDRAR